MYGSTDKQNRQSDRQAVREEQLLKAQQKHVNVEIDAGRCMCVLYNTRHKCLRMHTYIHIRDRSWALVKGFNLSYYNKETILFTVDPYNGNLN